MGSIYQLTSFLAVALLAIVITIFVFAVSLLGRAMETAARSEKDKLTEIKANNAEEMAVIRKEMEEAEASGRIPRGLTRKLKKLEKKDEKFEKELSKIRKAPELLTVKGGVVPVGASLLGALILAGVAWYLTDIQIFIWIIPILLWIVSFTAIGYSILRIYHCLIVIESVAIISEEAVLKRTIEAFKLAQKELEEEKKPELHLVFRDTKFPLHVKADSEVSLVLALSLSKGDLAEDVVVFVGAPKGFDFPNQDIVVLPSDHEYSNYICRGWNIERLIRGLEHHTTITIKSPPTVGDFKMIYYTFCKGFGSTTPTELEIIVE